MTPTIQSLETSGVPFVLYRLPKASVVNGYYQQDMETHRISLSKAQGFVFAPFTPEQEVLYIPNRFAFDIKDIPSPVASSKQVKLPLDGKAEVVEKVVNAKNEIAQGNFEKLVVSHRFQVPHQGNTYEIFNRLIHQYSNAFVYYWSHPQTGKWMGATPERLLEYDGKSMETMALAGTLAADMPDKAWSEKEFHEQQLVTNSIVQALSRKFDSSKIVIGPREIVRAGNLKHLQTRVCVNTSELALEDIVFALHPTPAVGGIPIGPSAEYIRKNEGYNRSFYTGFMGPIHKEKAQLFINLRCAHVTNNTIELFAGAGITANSTPEKEWDEICRKAQTFFDGV